MNEPVPLAQEFPLPPPDPPPAHWWNFASPPQPQRVRLDDEGIRWTYSNGATPAVRWDDPDLMVVLTDYTAAIAANQWWGLTAATRAHPLWASLRPSRTIGFWVTPELYEAIRAACVARRLLFRRGFPSRGAPGLAEISIYSTRPHRMY